MQSTHTVVIGAGQAGLAASRCLTLAGCEHVVLERDQIGSRWRRESWDSFRLLTPNWMTRLPDHTYAGSDPEGFMSADAMVRMLTDYAKVGGAPVIAGIEVLSVTKAGSQFKVETDAGVWTARNVIVATGWAQLPLIPANARDVRVHQLVPANYRNPELLPDGNVLIVGASASGVQLADEIARSGRDVTLAVGRHTRLPRMYRGMDSMWWLDRIGALDRTIDATSNPEQARLEPSTQLTGGLPRRSLDLATLQRHGVRLTGRMVDLAGHSVRFASDLKASTTNADDRLRQLLERIDQHIDDTGMTREVWESGPFPTVDASRTPTRLDLRKDGIGTVIWATGHRRNHSWLDLPVFDDSGEIWQRRGVTSVQGCYVLGQRFQYTRRSNFIDGVGADAAFVVGHLMAKEGRLARIAEGMNPDDA